MSASASPASGKPSTRFAAGADECDELAKLEDKARAALARTPARTLPDVSAKAAELVRVLRGDGADGMEMALGASLAADLEGMVELDGLVAEVEAKLVKAGSR